MDRSVVTPHSVWGAAIALSLILGFFFLKPFLPVSILALLLAFIFYPIYDYFLKKNKSAGKSALITTLLSIVIVGIPALIVITLTVTQTIQLVNDLASGGVVIENQNLTEISEDVTNTANAKLDAWFGIQEAIQTNDVVNFVQNTAPNVIKSIANALLSIVSGIPAFSTMLILYFFVFVSGLVHGKKLRSVVEQISPFDATTNKLYIERIGAMAKAMVKGQFLIAVAQGVVSALVLAILGLGSYFLFFAVIFTFLSFIPLGAGIVTIPLGIGYIIFGNFFGGALILLNHFLVVTNIDNYIRPKVVPKNAQLPAVLTILGAFAGVAWFGFIGVIYGPMIMIFIMTTIESYIDYKKRVEVVPVRN